MATVATVRSWNLRYAISGPLFYYSPRFSVPLAISDGAVWDRHKPSMINQDGNHPLGGCLIADCPRSFPVDVAARDGVLGPMAVQPVQKPLREQEVGPHLAGLKNPEGLHRVVVG